MKINETRLQQHFEAMNLIGEISTNRPAHSVDGGLSLLIAAGIRL